jgi:hypothetical protein
MRARGRFMGLDTVFEELYSAYVPISPSGAAVSTSAFHGRDDFASAILHPSIFNVSPLVHSRFAAFNTTYGHMHVEIYTTELVTRGRTDEQACEYLAAHRKDRLMPRWLLGELCYKAHQPNYSD